MLDITVKTLDGKNRTFHVNDDVTVRQFKEHIAGSIEIEADVQRLIFQGRVLDDGKKIEDYNVNGKTIHVVQKPPPSASRPGGSSHAESGPSRDREDRTRRDGNNFVLGSFTVPTADSPNHINNLVHQMLSGMGEMGHGAHVTTHSSADGSSVDVHINMGRIGSPQQSESSNRIQQALQLLSSAADTLNRLENPQQAAANTDVESHTSDEQPQRQEATDHDGSQQNESSGGRNFSTGSEARHPSVGALSAVLDQVLQVQDRLRPHLVRYRQLLNDDPDFTNRRHDLIDAQRLCDLTSEAMHGLSHSYHHISDLMVDWNRLPPRRLRAPPSAPTTAIIQQTIPVQINLAHMPVPSQAPPTTQPTSAQSTQTPGQPSAGSPRNRANGMRTEADLRERPLQQHPLPRGTFGPHFRMTSASGAFPMRPPTGFPHGFHVFMEMAPGTMPSGTGATGDQTSTTEAPSVSTSSGAQSRVPSNTAASGTDAGSTGVAGGIMFPPGEFLQNIIQMAANAAIQGQTGRQVFMMSSQPVSQTSAVSVTQTSSTSTASSAFSVPLNSHISPMVPPSVSSSSTQFAPVATSASLPTFMSFPVASAGQQQSVASEDGSRVQTSGGLFAGGVPMSASGIVPPVMPMPIIPPHFAAGPADMLPVDPYLPCNSRHFLARRAANAASQSNAASQNPDQTLTGIMSNVMSSIVRPLAEMGSGLIPSSVNTVYNPGGSLYTSSSSQAAGSATLSSSSSQSGSYPTASTQRSDVAAEHEMFANIMQGISAELQQVLLGQSSRSIGDFFGQLGNEYALPQGEGLLTDLFRIAANHLAFSDLMMIFFGQPSSLERLREPLREFISQSLLNGIPPSDSNMDAAVEHVIRDMHPDISSVGATIQTNENIDYTATVELFLRVQLRKFMRLIMTSSAGSEFAGRLYNCCRTFVHEFVVLNHYILRGGQEALQALIQERLRAISSEMNPSMQNTMSTMAAQQLQQILPTIRVHDSDILQYIVRSNTESVQSVSSDSSFESACDTADDEPQEARRTVAEVNVDSYMVQPRISDALLSHLPTPPDSNSEADVEVAFGSEDWHAAVPTDWIPVITRDIVRQRRQAPQPSLSDAYLSGMPTKRRKTLARDRQREEFADVRTILPDAIQRAAQQAGAVPVTSISDISHEVANNSRLCAAFQQEVNSAICQRLANDPGYIPEKYPNTEKFFKPN